jgi:hypothetical protein
MYLIVIAAVETIIISAVFAGADGFLGGNCGCHDSSGSDDVQWMSGSQKQILHLQVLERAWL